VHTLISSLCTMHLLLFLQCRCCTCSCICSLVVLTKCFCVFTSVFVHGVYVCVYVSVYLHIVCVPVHLCTRRHVISTDDTRCAQRVDVAVTQLTALTRWHWRNVVQWYIQCRTVITQCRTVIHTVSYSDTHSVMTVIHTLSYSDTHSVVQWHTHCNTVTHTVSHTHSVIQWYAQCRTVIHTVSYSDTHGDRYSVTTWGYYVVWPAADWICSRVLSFSSRSVRAWATPRLLLAGG